MSQVIGSIQHYEHETTINFPIDKVKAAVMSVYTLYPNIYKLRDNDINETFNTYRIPVVKTISPGIIDLSLQEIPEGRTTVKIAVSNLHGSKTSNTILSGIANDYMLILSKLLNGETPESIKSSVKNTGCLMLLIVMITLSVSLIIF